MTSPREYGFEDLTAGAPGPGSGEIPGLGAWSPQKIEGILLLINNALAQVRQLVQWRASLGGPGGGPATLNPGPREISVSDLNMADLKLMGKGLIQLAVERLGDKKIDEIIDDWGPVRLSQFEKML